jgi:hypothetical protein
MKVIVGDTPERGNFKRRTRTDLRRTAEAAATTDWQIQRLEIPAALLIPASGSHVKGMLRGQLKLDCASKVHAGGALGSVTKPEQPYADRDECPEVLSGEDQLPVLGQSQSILAAIVLDDELASRPEQLDAGDPAYGRDWRRCCNIEPTAFRCCRTLVLPRHEQTIIIPI